MRRPAPLMRTALTRRLVGIEPTGGKHLGHSALPAGHGGSGGLFSYAKSRRWRPSRPRTAGSTTFTAMFKQC